MSDTPPAGAAPKFPAPKAFGNTSLRSLAILGYVLFLLACFNGFTAIIGVIIAYVKRRDAAGTIWHSHFTNLILVFWVTIGGALLGVLSWPIAFGTLFARHFFWLWPPTAVFPLFFGFLILPLLALWYLYRIIRGLIRAGEDRPY
jgi:uncharacterized membrane protein